jgi:hemolysin activation/secretion protein
MKLISRKAISVFFLLAGGLCFFSGVAAAANEDRAINGGASAAVQESKIRDQAQEQLFKPRAEKPIAFEEEQAPAGPATGPSFFVKKIFLEGDVMLAPEEYDPLLKQLENREVRFEEIQRLINVLEQLFRAKGYIAVVLLPPQKMEKQEIHLKAVISRMGNLSVENNRYFAKWRTLSYWGIRKGDILRYDKIRENVMNMNENPDRIVKPILKAGAEKGTTDVVLDVEDHFPGHFGYSFDNQGVKLTGKDRQGFTLRNNNMLGLDDTFLIGTTFGKAFGALYLYHVIPISNFGTKFIWSFSHAQVNPKKEFSEFGINGTSETYSLALQQRVIRTDKYSGNVQLGFDFKEKHTSQLSQTVAWDKERVISFSGNLQSRDRWGGWGLGQGVYFGLPTFNDDWPLASGGGVQSFFKYTYSLTRVTQLPWRTKALWDLQGQLSPDQLLPQEQMFLGGARSIRGYPESDYGADSALQSRLDYMLPPYGIPDSWKLPFDTAPLKDQLNAIAFFDTGYGRTHAPEAESENRSDFLMGVGGGFELRFRKSISARMEWGVPVGDNPVTEGGKSQLHFTFNVNY